MALIFKYAHVPRKDGSLRQAPYLPIYAKNRFGQTMRILALIDSGADSTVIPKDLAMLLGLGGKEYGKTGGIGGEVKVKYSRFRFNVIGNRERYSLDVPALILDQENSDVPLLLGRHGFFENFHITFRQNEEKIILKRIQPKRLF